MTSNKVSENFSIFHHELNMSSYETKMTWWKGELTSGNRCSKCWLRMRECFCYKLTQFREEIYGNKAQNIRICIYYHFQEIGRSANTAHVLEALNPMGCESMVFGDTDAELKLLEDIKSEIESDNPSTCILYPCSNSILMSDWIQTRTKSMKISEHSSPTRKNDGTIRLVVLDGTYANASRLWKYLTKSMRLLYNLELPVVKLDLEHGRCRSAIVGIMSQPGEEKICSFQAAVMAMRQADCDVNICNKLNNVLDEWLLYMLKTKVKFGKSKFRLIPGVDRTPSDHIREFLELNPPPLGPPPSRKCRKPRSERNGQTTSKKRKGHYMITIQYTKKFNSFDMKKILG